MNNQELLNELKQTKKLLSKVQKEFRIKPKNLSVKSLLHFYYRKHPEKLNHDNPGFLKKIIQLVSDRSVHFLLFMFGVVYPISIMGGNLTRTLAKTISIGTVSKYIVFDVTSNIFIYIFLLIIYMLAIMILSHYYKKQNLKNIVTIKKINRFMRNVYNQVLLYIINMFTIYATLIGTIFTISSSINKLKIVLTIALFFSLIIIPVLSISLFVSTISKINDFRI